MVKNFIRLYTRYGYKNCGSCIRMGSSFFFGRNKNGESHEGYMKNGWAFFFFYRKNSWITVDQNNKDGQNWEQKNISL